MNPIEKTIRTALERGDADDRAYREKVYRSVYAALEKNIAANPDLSDHAVERRREMLKASILTVEQEFVPAFEPESPAEAEDSFDFEEAFEDEEAFEAPAAPNHRMEPFPQVQARGSEPRSSWAAASSRYYGGEAQGRTSAWPRQQPPREPVIVERQPRPAFDDGPIPLPDIEPRHPARGRDRGTASSGLDGLAPRRDVRSRGPRIDAPVRGGNEPRGRRGRIFIILFLAVTFFAAGAMAVWWAMDSGLFLSAEERDTSVPNPPLKLEDEEFQPGAPPPLSEGQPAGGNGGDWITVFTPTDPTRVLTLSGGTAQVIEIEGGVALRIRSSAPNEPVRFEVGQGTLQAIAGRSAVFNIRARTEPGRETEILVTCDFGALGDCGRKRYVVSSENRDYAVALDVPDVRPTGAGSIAIVTDFGDGGRSVDIIDISVTVPD
ncbi:hypothetical protein [Aquibium microcysteis]|uniref:hypothetical protein n=1 Tax=Aquibium microcysteis TaxID=675281 RepID=UPI00165D02B2|nr:hypothetical protein [Aquibium microcysteis]